MSGNIFQRPAIKLEWAETCMEGNSCSGADHGGVQWIMLGMVKYRFYTEMNINQLESFKQAKAMSWLICRWENLSECGKL